MRRPALVPTARQQHEQKDIKGSSGVLTVSAIPANLDDVDERKLSTRNGGISGRTNREPKTISRTCQVHGKMTAASTWRRPLIGPVTFAPLEKRVTYLRSLNDDDGDPLRYLRVRRVRSATIRYDTSECYINLVMD